MAAHTPTSSSARRGVVDVRREAVTIPTYSPLAADRNPMFFEKRVYQGSNGKVYPLPFVDRISEKCRDVPWDAIHLENDFVYLMVLPQIGGRIHVARDKTNGYDLIYRQDVIKPALVGLNGPWISGGIEFNWPQHHRPATYMPAGVEVERHDDGSVTIWCSDHDPITRMKGMHGICLHPNKAYIEVKVRAYNRTPLVQTFLWWANVATRVHESYQSFFPPDVHYVADHARRSTSAYPLCRDRYYGVNYAGRAKDGVRTDEIPTQYRPPHTGGAAAVDYAANDLSFYANIPVPTSYMCMGSREDFFGGYDHRARAGIVHIANHHISPGKKQWTWGNHEFGCAWDRNLTDADARGEHAPYIELMAGVYTDNQPDFAFLMPGETKTWSQYWYPIQDIGAARHANLEAALNLRLQKGKAIAGVSVSATLRGATITLLDKGRSVFTCTRDLAPGAAWTEEIRVPANTRGTDLRLTVVANDGSEVISYQPAFREPKEVPSPATEPRAPEAIESADEMYLIGLHLEQYRHATRDPCSYWREGLRRDPGDSRCNNALGLWHLRRGEFGLAEAHFRKSIERLTRRNANPYDGEPFYNLGLTLRHLGRDDEAYAVFYKSVWNQAWQSAGYHAIAELDCKLGRWTSALEHLDRALRLNTDNLRARNLRVIVLRKLGRDHEAERQLEATRALDPLDWWSRSLAGKAIAADTQTRLDLALDFARAGLYADAIALLQKSTPESGSGTAPLVGYYLSRLNGLVGNTRNAKAHGLDAAKERRDYCFPFRLEEISILEHAIRLNPKDSAAFYYLGNLLYDRSRHLEAIALWKQSAELDPTFAIVWRNLGIGYFNVAKAPAKARAAYDKAFKADSSDARLLYERDQLWKLLSERPARRLAELEKRLDLVSQRDDLSVAICALYNQVGRHADALRIVSKRHFQPWEGGEGQALGQHVRTHLALGRVALANKDTATACEHFTAALASPRNLGEAKHLLANQSDIHYWLGVALERSGDVAGASRSWQLAAESRGDFQDMSVRTYSEMTYYSAASLQRLGQKADARRLLNDLLAYARKLAKMPATIDYFATSLPTMLVFDDDIQLRQQIAAQFLEAQALFGLGRRVDARKRLTAVLKRDPNHPLAEDFLSQL
jgi:tetratricopeptide (TPR) repeat protein